MGVAAGTFSCLGRVPFRLSLLRPLSRPPPHLSWQVGLLPGSRQLPQPSQPPHRGQLLCRGKPGGTLSYFVGPSRVTREGEPQISVGILSFAETSFPSEESQGLAGLNSDLFFALKLYIYLIN